MTMIDVFARKPFDVPKVFLEEPIQVKPYMRRPATKRRPRQPVEAVERDPTKAVMDVIALMDHMRGGPVVRAKQEARQERKTKTTAFLLFVLLAGAVVFMLWAGTHG